MKTALAIRNSPLLSYVYFNPLFRASRSIRRKLRRQAVKLSPYSRPKTA
jgi:hypothetical protein